MNWRRLARILLVTAAIGYLILGLASFFPDRFWFFETLSNLRALFAWSGGLGAILLTVARLRIWAALVTAALVAHVTMAMLRDFPRAEIATATPNLRVMTINIGFRNGRDNDQLLEIIRREHPDILLLIEDRPRRRQALADKIGYLPYHAETGIDWRAISIHSRYPLTDVVVESTTYVAHILTAHVSVPTGEGARDVLFVATHPTSPTLGWLAWQRKKALDHLSARARDAGVPVILAGDLNLTGQSVYFARLLSDGGLGDTAHGIAPAPTWLLSIPSLGLRIDHVLVSRDIQTTARRVGPGFGSDHRPLTVDLVVMPPR